MTVIELITLLQEMPPELQVYSYCDHGQCPEKSGNPSIAYTASLDHSLWEEWTGLPFHAEDEEYGERFVML